MPGLFGSLLVVLEPARKVTGLPGVVEIAVLRIPALRWLAGKDVHSHPQAAVSAEADRASGCRLPLRGNGIINYYVRSDVYKTRHVT